MPIWHLGILKNMPRSFDEFSYQFCFLIIYNINSRNWKLHTKYRFEFEVLNDSCKKFQSSYNNAITPGPTWAYWLLCSSGERQYITPSDNIDFIARMRSMRVVKSICHEGLYIVQATRAEKSICPSRPWSTSIIIWRLKFFTGII